MSLIHLFLLVSLVSLEADATTSFSSGSRSILRDIGSNDISDHKDNAVELNATNFDSVFQDTSAKFAVLEFFAHWSVFSLDSIWKKASIFRLGMFLSPEIYQEKVLTLRVLKLNAKVLFCAVPTLTIVFVWLH